MPEIRSESPPADAPEHTSADAPEHTSADAPEHTSADAPEHTSADAPETTSADAPENTSAGASADAPENTSENTSADASKTRPKPAKAPAPKPAEGPEPAPATATRPLWVLLGAVLMGGIALGGALVVMKTGLLMRFESPVTRFWIFELGTALGYFLGGLILALISPGRTTREPMYAAGLAFLGQTGVLWYADWVGMTPRVFLVMLALCGAFAWVGAFLGEKLTGAT